MSNNFLNNPTISETNKIKQDSFLDDVSDNSSEVIPSVIDNSIDGTVEENHVAKPINKTKYISATSKISTELNNVWYAFSFTESREIQDDSNIEDERINLWNTVNTQVDTQVQDVIFAIKNSGSQE